MQPHKIMRVTSYALENIDDQKIAFLCCQCNLCELFACLVGLYPKAANQFIKLKLVEKNIKYKVQNGVDPFKSREYRLLPSKRLIARFGLYDFDKPAPITEISIKSELIFIARRQHAGNSTIAVVGIGDNVEEGQLIGKIPENSLGVTIRASISCTVVKITQDYIAIRGN